LQFTVRTDGSSRFGNENKYGFFPSGSAGWRVSDEKFMQNLTFISDLKLRASWGITGNAEFGDNFGSRSTIGYGPLYLGIGNAVGVTPIRLANDNLRWERTLQTNYGIDISVLNNRINFTADYYTKDTRDLLLFVSLPATTGFGGTFQNIGRMRNSGIEFAIRSENIVGSTFTWNTQFNIGFNKNKILALADNNDIRAGANVARVGNPLSFNVFNLGNPIVNPQTGLLQNPGDAPDRTEILGGSPFPKFTGGFTNNFAYKGFDLSVFLQFVYGNKIYNGTRSLVEDMRGFYNGSKRLLDRWQNPGDITDIPVASLAPEVVRTNSGFNSIRYLEDGSFLRIKNVTLGYNVPEKWTKKIKLNRVRIYASGQNLLVFTKYLGFDPEVNAVTGNDLFSNISRGLDNGTYPQARTIVMGLNLDF
jgi:TonB-dependent starch-binding outer membrane protein SusC